MAFDFPFRFVIAMNGGRCTAVSIERCIVDVCRSGVFRLFFCTEIWYINIGGATGILNSISCVSFILSCSFSAIQLTLDFPVRPIDID